MNPDLARLQPYPFEKLRQLLSGAAAPDQAPVDAPAGQSTPVSHVPSCSASLSHCISLSIGEPKRAAPAAVQRALAATLSGLETYPSTLGTEVLRESIARWLMRRYGLEDATALAERHVLPVNGTREALFAIAQCVLDRTAGARQVLMPNPFYQIYEGAALLAGCEPSFYAIDGKADAELDAIEPAAWKSCQMIYVCNPGNPTGAVLSETALQRLITLAHEHDFIIASDECYSEIYRETARPPCGLLQAARSLGVHDYSRCLAFHSLSKRSNLPGLRSGFVAGDAALIERFLLYRTYQGCSMSPPVQHASIAAWSDEMHVVENRRAYDANFQAAIDELGPVVSLTTPPGGFYLWPTLPDASREDDQRFTRRLYEQANVRVVPGSFLAREVNGHNPGAGKLRLALVAPLAECREAARRIRTCLETTT